MKLNIDTEIPPVVYLPWNPLTLEMFVTPATAGTALTLTSNNLITALSTQLRLSTTALPTILTNLVLRVRGIKVWAPQQLSGSPPVLTPSPASLLKLDCYSLSPEETAPETDYIFSGTDGPGVVSWPSIGYMWPLNQQNQVFGYQTELTGASVADLTVNYNTSSQQYLVRFMIYWRTYGVYSVSRTARTFASQVTTSLGTAYQPSDLLTSHDNIDVQGTTSQPNDFGPGFLADLEDTDSE